MRTTTLLLLAALSIGCRSKDKKDPIPGLPPEVSSILTSSNPKEAAAGEESFPISGDPAHFDPFAALPEIRRLVGDGARLVKVSAIDVGSDGTTNLTTTGRVDYEFRRPAKSPPAEMPPVGSSGRTPDSVWVEKVEVEVIRPGTMRKVQTISGGVSVKTAYAVKGIIVRPGSARMDTLPAPVADPPITTKAMWAEGVKVGAPQDAVGTSSPCPVVT